ncbi:hypothetical protein [Rhizobium sp. Root1220]|uniref:hypothetical protein n=1 Tax=Rhizobium sp. Root1220 TaxID=1736432 RepID=UPI0006FD1710|nr:hypothetical protein [Rhizobium sp. Root1220]KQV80017.1 hypothetical protein ASC90_25790 [Rhizobium sp. Root1220]
MKIAIRSTIAMALVVGSMFASANIASADDWRRHHHHNNGDAVVGGLAAGVIGGLIGGAIANNSGPRYIDPPPPPPRCWFEDRRVQNAYDGGWHMENIRVCE